MNRKVQICNGSANGLAYNSAKKSLMNLVFVLFSPCEA